MTEKPWVVPYDNIITICNENGTLVELIEQTNCYGGAAWARHHFLSSSSLILDSKIIGNSTRYLLKTGKSSLNLVPSISAAGIESVIVKENRVEVTYAGMGGGGVGATACRSLAKDVLNSQMTESGGSRLSRGTIVLPRSKRVIIGVDDTDTKDEGATWALVHNIASRLDNKSSRYVSHSIVQLFPVQKKTQNCVSTVVEFACTDEKKFIENFRKLLLELTLSDETGMVVLQSFDAKSLEEFGKLCKSKEVKKEDAITASKYNNVQIEVEGEGVIGAVASLPYFSRPSESVKM